jgi:tricorn protease-like protein
MNTQMDESSLKETKYNDLIKISKELGIVFNFQKKPELIKLILANQKVEISKMEIKTETSKSPIKYKEPIGTIKEYKDGSYILTEQGWRKQKTQII